MVEICSSGWRSSSFSLSPSLSLNMRRPAVDEEPRQLAICAGQIKSLHQGVFGPGALDNSCKTLSLPPFIIMLLLWLRRQDHIVWPLPLMIKVGKRKYSSHNRRRSDYIRTQALVSRPPLSLLAAIVWVTGKWKKEIVPRPLVSFQSGGGASPSVTTALFGIWGVSLWREADN